MAEPMLSEPLEEVSADGKAMSDNDLAALLASHEANAVGYFSDEIADEQALSLDYYYGRPFGDEEEGRSQVVDRTVQIVVDNAVAALIKPFLSSDEAVVFEPRGPEDEEAAKQATEYVNYVFNVDNSGFLLMHNWFKAALLEKLGIVKVWWEDSEQKRVERMEGLDAAQLEFIMAQAERGDFAIVGGPYQDEDGLFAIDIEREYKDGCIRMITVPSEEFLIAPYSRDIETAEYSAHRPSNLTRSDLLDMGFDEDVVDGLPAATSSQIHETRSTSRFEDEGTGGVNDGIGVGNDKSMDRIALLDEYVMVDYDGDGIAERRRIIRVNDEILLNEEWAEPPFALLCPVPMPHKVYGQSLADQTRDLQRINSVLLRQSLDNYYLHNNPKMELPYPAINEDGSTLDDLSDPSPGGVIRTKVGGLINPIMIPFVADKAFGMFEYLEQQQEARTGISRAGQGLDQNALRKSGQMTATEIAQIAEGKNSRVEMIARIFAETGVKRLFSLILKLLIDHQPRERMIRLRNQWVQMDPRSWNAEMDVAVTVGLGVGSKAEQISKANSVIELMAEVAQSPYSQLVGPEQAYHALKRSLNAHGIKDVENYLIDPQEMEPQPEQPDPAVIEAQAKVNEMQQKLQLEQMKSAAKFDLEREVNTVKLELEREKNAQKAEIEAQKNMQKAALEQERAAFEADLAERKAVFEASLAQQKADAEEEMARKKADAGLPDNRPGGDLDK